MIIYGEYLFIENFITGILILNITGKICGYKTNRWRIVSGGVLCGIYSFAILLDMNGLWGLISKLTFSIFVVALVYFVKNPNLSFKKSKWICVIKTTVIFYIVSFFLGGITIAVLYMTKMPAVTANGAYYTDGITYATITAGIVAGWILGEILVQFIKKQVLKNKLFLSATVYVGEKSWNLNAFIDTGNFLKEPISGEAVAVITQSAAQKILNFEEMSVKYCVIPYKTLGKHGILDGFHIDNIRVGDKDLGKMTLAISKEDFNGSNDASQDYEIILQQEIIEGGILYHEQSGV